MKISIGTFIKFIISLGLGIGLISFLNSKLSPAERTQIWSDIQHISPSYILITLILGALACVIRAFRWKMLLKPLGYQPRNSTLIASIFIMYVGNLAFPRLGEVLRCSVLLKEEDIPLEKSIGTMIVERLIDFMGLGLIAFLAIVFEYEKIVDIYKQYKALKGEFSLWFPMLILGLILVGIFAIWYNPKWRKVLLEKLMGMLDGLKSIFKLESPWLFIFFSLSIYFIYFITTYILYLAFSELAHLSLSSALVTLTAGTLGVGLTQGGIGAFQYLVTWTLEKYQIPTTTAQSYSWASWGMQTANLVFWGILSWIYIMRRKNV